MRKLIVLAGLFTILFLGCKKDVVITGGTGGKGEIKGYSSYNGKATKPTTFYIKYATITSPGTDITKYDFTNSSDLDGKFSFKELTQGDYYIYALSSDNGQALSGGVHVILLNNEIKDNVVISVNP